MTPALLAAQLATDAIYDPITPGAFDQVYRIDETVCGTKLLGNRLHVVMQGTQTLAGWMADADIDPIAHPVLGRLHSGFWHNLPALAKVLCPDMDAMRARVPGLEIQCEGHSKGAGEAVQLAGMLHAVGWPVVQCYLFACPNAGFADFAGYMQAHVPGVSYHNAPRGMDLLGDPVPLVPLLPYVAPYPHTQVCAPPPGVQRLLGVEWHLGERYLEALSPAAVAA